MFIKLNNVVFNLFAAILPLLIFFGYPNGSQSQTLHPHISVKAQDKQATREKTNKQEWAKKVFDRMKCFRCSLWLLFYNPQNDFFTIPSVSNA
jgi:hypothetical protein